jgi:S-adenosylmethionine-diacylglycerol 3-amino-3-carboxypropyl transferase
MKHPIKYSMCWEDPELVINGLQISKKDTVLSIASGGENIFAILLKEPKSLIAIDSNPYQLYLCKLKALAIKHLDYDEFYNFIGFGKSKNRVKIYNKLKAHLTSDEKIFWNEHHSHIQGGIVHCGKFEHYLNYFRRFILKFVLNNKQIKKYLESNNIKKQEDFFKREWDKVSWKLLFKVFFSRFVMKILGRDKSYFFHNKISSVSEHYYNRSKYGITKIPIKNNYFMHMILTGTIPKHLDNHPYLDKNNFLKLKKIS